MSFENISRLYLNKVGELLRSEGYQNEATPELSYRPALNEYLENISVHFNPRVETIFEPRTQSRSGRPDWRFHDREHLGIYGYIEAKGLDTRLQIIPENYQSQVQKYLSLGHKVILTDGVDFTFFNGASLENVSLINKPLGNNIHMQQINIALEEKFRSFFSGATFRQCSESELIDGVAIRCRRLSDGVLELLEIPQGAGFNQQENNAINSLNRLYQTLQLRHDSRLNSKKTFSDFVAQVLGFGLLLAHRVLDAPALSPTEVKNHLERFWIDAYFDRFTDELSPFKELSRNLREELTQLGSVGTWYQDTIFYLSHVRLNSNQVEKPSYHVLFERFLTKFDPETRFDFGAFYTPEVLSNYTVGLSEEAALAYFGTSIFSEENKIIDPCCGTGTFLESLIQKNTSGRHPLLIGLEILPGPYALAKYRLKFLEKVGNTDRIKIFLTNTLSDVINQTVMEEGTTDDDPFLRERNLVRTHSQPPITLVIGNPPSSDSGEEDGVSTEIIDSLLEDFRPSEQERSSRQNIQKQISNPFMKFLRWSFDKTVQSRRGICSLLLPSTFLKNRSYFWARSYLQQHCSSIYVLDIDKDLRAVDSSNLFDVQQGRALILFIFNSSQGREGVFYKSILELSRAEKNQFLAQNQISLEGFELVDMNAANRFCPSSEEVNIFPDSVLVKLYSASEEDTTSVYVRNCNGLKLSPTTFFIHSRPELLIRRLLEFKRSTSAGLAQLLDRWFRGQIKPPKPEKLTAEVLAAIPVPQIIGSKVFKYSFRPFLELNAFVDEEVFKVLAHTAGGGARLRPEIMATSVSQGYFRGISVAPAPSELGDKLKPFASFCWGIPDNDLCSRGNSKILSTSFPKYKTRNNWNPNPILNIGENILNKLVENYGGLSRDEIISKLEFYVFGVLRSNFYLQNFSTVLFGVAGESIPPIFFPVSSDVFCNISALGKKMAELESPLGRSSLAGIGELTQLKNPFQFSSFDADSSTGVVKFFENKSLVATIVNIPGDVLGFELSGYNVVETYLKFNKYSYTNSETDTSGLEDFRRFLASISESILTSGLIDSAIDELDDNELIVFS